MAKPLKVIIESTLEDLADKIEALTVEYQLNQGKDIGTFYIVPEQEVAQKIAGHPQILMLFRQPLAETTENFPRQVVARVSFRLMRSPESLVPQDLISLANRIETLFLGSTPLLWRYGKESYSYFDLTKGYQLRVLAENETEARKLIEQVLDVQSHSPDWEIVNKNVALLPAQKYDDTPPKRTLLGKQYRKPRRRPRVTLKLWKAEIFIPGVAGNISLCNDSGYIFKGFTS